MLEALLRREVLRLFVAEFEVRDRSIIGSGYLGDPYTRAMGWLPECQIADYLSETAAGHEKASCRSTRCQRPHD